MRKIFVSIILTCAIQARCDVLASLSFASLAENKRVESVITRERILRTPVWNTDDDSPPLAPRKADVLATSKFHSLFKDIKGWERKSIMLESVVDASHWIYVVEYGPVDAQLGLQFSVQICVLMDGTVVQPNVTDAK